MAIKAIYTDVPVYRNGGRSAAYKQIVDLIGDSIQSGYYIASSCYWDRGKLRVSCIIQDTPFEDQSDNV